MKYGLWRDRKTGRMVEAFAKARDWQTDRLLVIYHDPRTGVNMAMPEHLFQDMFEFVAVMDYDATITGGSALRR